MKILKQNQYNQSVGRSKLLSSTSGVGSIVPTRHGTYVLISDINKWHFIDWVNIQIDAIKRRQADASKIYNESKGVIIARGMDFIDDERFVEFLKKEMEIHNLVCLVAIPHMSLNDTFNSPVWSEHPILKALQSSRETGFANQYMIEGTHFPKWFISSSSELKTLDSWKSIWSEECRNHPGRISRNNFAPPRDPRGFIQELSIRNEDGGYETLREYKTLQQTNLVLICPNGHLSDIPWSQYLKWKTEKIVNNQFDDFGEDLFKVYKCCPNPDLRWSEDGNKSDGYGSIFIHCERCGTGKGGLGHDPNYQRYPRVSLEGINTLKPRCKGEMPWKIHGGEGQPPAIPSERCINTTNVDQEALMKVSLATANNVYYTNGFSSLFIPLSLALDRPKVLIEATGILEEKYKRYNNASPIERKDYWDRKVVFHDFMIDNAYTEEVVGDLAIFEQKLMDEFLSLQHNGNDESDKQVEYRWQEYNTFSRLSRFPTNRDEECGFAFDVIELSDKVLRYFKKIQRVESLNITNVQLDFTRDKPKERIVVNGIVQQSTSGQRIFSKLPQELYVLPANISKGEGLFFQISDEAISEWKELGEEYMKNRFRQFFANSPDSEEQGVGPKMRIYNNGYKHYLIHTFSHMMMRELEFSCGYPTASLKERLYISEDSTQPMSGVLIYTAEGAEGSMGGLVSQGNSDRLTEILTRGLERMLFCSSDPLCWESDGQGVFGLNLASCFSCSLVAETACEEMNLGLDRRVLVDDQFGFFKDFLT
jgi:hypothetical protein